MTPWQHIRNAEQTGVLDLGKMRRVLDDSLGPFFGRIEVSAGLIPGVRDACDRRSNMCHQRDSQKVATEIFDRRSPQ